MTDRPVFYFDFSSPYSYLAAERIHDVFEEPPVWQPISFGFLIREVGKTPWSLGDGREAGIAEVARRAAERGLPEVLYPEGWPDRSYSLLPLRAAIYAGEVGRMVSFSLATFRQHFAAGRDLSDVDNVLLAAASCELHPRAILKALETRAVKDRLREATEEAIARGVTGVPTVAVGDLLFWGDDRLEEAAVAARS